ncbi:sensor histidine kinase [Paenibacillus mendelii]|uniref:histidine kinase n=1 Tax=Paenibacillus mendelii TaxID=206163 RepID=A0ABV6JFC6_9BACL|nr:histidine kinase [Paenibacillus mendelii]MCQ6557447.1 histidine kinase [Paenibacillus mendelii]
MRFQRHRNRLILIAFLLSVLSGSILICISYWNTSGVGLEIHHAAQQNITKHAESQLVTKFNDISALAAHLESADYMNYSREYYNLREPVEAERIGRDLNVRLNKLHLQPDMVERVYIIGENKNQKNLGKSFEEQGLIPEQEIPWIDDLRAVGLIDLFTRYYGMPSFIPQGMFTDKLNDLSIPEERRSRLKAFFESIEGRLIMNNGVNYLNVLTVIVLDNRLFTLALPDRDSWDGYIGVLDNNSHVLWSNFSNEATIRKAVEQRKEGLANWSQGLSSDYEVRTETIAPYGIDFMFFERKASNVIWDQSLLQICVILFGIMLVVNLLISYKISNMIMYPFNVLARISWKKEKDIDFQHIPEERFEQFALSKISIRQKILLLLVTSVMIPFIAAVALHVSLTYHSLFNKLVQSTVQSSDQLVKEMRNRMDNYESLTNGISADGRLTNLFLSYQYAPIMDDKFPVSSYPGLVDVSYFVLYNSQGVARFSSTFINNITLFRLSTSELNSLSKLKPEQIIWITGKKDVYNHTALMLIKKVSLPTSDGTSMDAYLQVVLKEDAFQSVTSGRRESLVLMDRSGEVVYTSTSEPGFTEAAIQELNAGALEQEQAHFGKVEASNQVILERAIPESEWTSVLFYTIDDIYLKINEMFYRYLLLIVLILLAIFGMVWHLSLYLVKPIERLKRAMEEGAALGEAVMTDSNPRDEIGLLVLSFNNMITRINDLMEENINKQIREKELVTSKMKAELGMLQQQINPHFLYNTLEAINMRARQYGAMEVSAMVNSLANIFRFTINTGSEVVLLSEEIEHVRNYLTIQALRFKDAFIVNWDIDDEVPPTITVLKFILQPLVENALQHGIEELYEQGEIYIGVKMLQDEIRIQIRDNGLGMSDIALREILRSLNDNYEAGAQSDDEPGKRSSGVGLRNVYYRLRIYYGDSFAMTIESQEFEGTAITLRIPLQR